MPGYSNPTTSTSKRRAAASAAARPSIPVYRTGTIRSPALPPGPCSQGRLTLEAVLSDGTVMRFALEITAGLLTIAVVGAVVLARRPTDLQPIPEPESMTDQGDEPLTEPLRSSLRGSSFRASNAHPIDDSSGEGSH